MSFLGTSMFTSGNNQINHPLDSGKVKDQYIKLEEDNAVEMDNLGQM